jgi:histidyl-tRNA synthetase
MPVMLDHLCEACQKHFESVQKDLKNLKVNYILDKTLVRGLDYYNRTVFEISSQSLGAQDAVGGGGRYDGLVQDLGGPATPAVGYAGGMERLILLLGENFESYRPELTAFFVTPDEKGRDKSFLLASELRQQGLRVEMDHTGRSMKSQMKRADRLKALWTIIIGGQEVDKGLAVVRNMKSKEQIEIPFEKIAEKIQEKSL